MIPLRSREESYCVSMGPVGYPMPGDDLDDLDDSDVPYCPRNRLLMEGIAMTQSPTPFFGSPRCNMMALMWSVFECIIMFGIVAVLTGCISVDKRVTVVVYPGGTARVTTTNASETKADGNQLHADPDLSISPVPIP